MILQAGTIAGLFVLCIILFGIGSVILNFID